MSGEFLELEFHPTNPDTIYTVKKEGDKTEFYRSVDGGSSFQLQSAGWPDPDTGAGEHQRRTEIAALLTEEAVYTVCMSAMMPEPTGPSSAVVLSQPDHRQPRI